MRRTKNITAKILIFLLLAGVCNIFSFALDQQVVQQEDKIREKSIQRRQENSKIENLKIVSSNVDLSGLEVETASENRRAFLLKDKMELFVKSQESFLFFFHHL